MLDSLLLYAGPLLARLCLSWPGEEGGVWWDACVSLIPLAIMLPSPWLPRCFPTSPETEHVVRHAVYAFAFTVAAATNLRWDVIWEAQARGDAWVPPLLAYTVAGALTLWWFCLSHILENLGARLYTHQGDVVVLPLTLVAITAFAHDVPDEAFRYFRSIVYFVPVIVAWATLHFVAYNDFAIGRVTTYETEAFLYLAHAGLVVGSAQLVLLELNATPLTFQFLPVVASVVCQVTRRSEDRVRLRPRSELSTALASACIGVGIVGLPSLAIKPELPSSTVVASTGVVFATLSVVIPCLAGSSWIVPSALYGGLVSATLWVHFVPVHPLDAGGIVALHYLALWVCDLLLSPGSWTRDPPRPHHPPPPHPRGTPLPQVERAPCWAPSRVLRALSCRLPQACWCWGNGLLGRRKVYSRDTAREWLEARPKHPSCPDAFAGLWWMEGNPYPMELVCVQSLEWRRDPRTGAATARLWMRKHTSRHATLAGLWQHLALSLGVQQLTEWTPESDANHDTHGGDDGRALAHWIRTDGWLGIPHLLPDTYWLYRVSDDEMIRLVYSGDKIVWRYRMLRIARDAHTPTRFYADFLRQHEGEPYFVA